MFDTNVATFDAVTSVSALARVEPGRLGTDDQLDAIAECERLSSWVASRQLELMAAFARRRPAQDAPGRRVRDSFPDWLSEFAAEEIAPLLHVASRTAQDRLLMAVDLVERHPGTLDALATGQISLVQARIISATTLSVGDADVRAVESAVLPQAPGQTAGQLRATVEREMLKACPEAADRRRAEARTQRRVEFDAQPDGMASLWLFGPAERIASARTGIEALALQNRRAAGRHAGDPDDPGIDAFRFDAAIQLLVGEDAEGPSTPSGPLFQVIAQATTILGLDDAPCELTGYGPITAETAREIAGWAGVQWQRLLTDPATGLITDIGATYRPPGRTAALVMARHGHCRFPGCRRPAEQCDLDHVEPWPLGRTGVANLGPLCRRHHRLKTHTDWTVRQRADGTYEWRSPTGRIYVTTPR